MIGAIMAAAGVIGAVGNVYMQSKAKDAADKQARLNLELSNQKAQSIEDMWYNNAKPQIIRQNTLERLAYAGGLMDAGITSGLGSALVARYELASQQVKALTTRETDILNNTSLIRQGAANEYDMEKMTTKLQFQSAIIGAATGGVSAVASGFKGGSTLSTGK